MKAIARNHFVLTVVSLMVCLISTLPVKPATAEDYLGQGKDQLVDALDAAFARVLDSGQWRAIVNSDPVVAPLAVNMADCYPRIEEDGTEIYPFPQNPTGLLADILASKQIRVGTYAVGTTPGTFHIFDNVNPLLLRAIIDELGNGYGIPPSPDPGAIQIVHVDVWPPSSNLLYSKLNNGDFDITNFNAALGATAQDKRRRKLARFTCTIFGTQWHIHVKDTSSYQTMDDVLADTTADLCVGQLSSRLSEDYFRNAQSIAKQFTTDDLVVCSQGVSDGTFDAYLHFDPIPSLPDLRSIPMGITSGIPIWVAGDQDRDNDRVADDQDNCPDTYNTCQADSDENGIGDACDSTLVELSTLKAIPSDLEVTIEWATESEVDNAGFNIWRAERFVKINEDMISTEGSVTEGAEYDFVDDWVLNGRRYFYLLEDVDLFGKSTMHGPVTAKPRMIYGIGK